MSKKQEQVLCIDRKTLPASWVTQRTVLSMDFPTFAATCTKAKCSFVRRGIAEEDRQKKQIIPYILLQTADGGMTAAYNRQGNEKRLHDLWSIGIGGHINPEDSAIGTDSFESILKKGMQRELDEELARRVAGDPIEFIGIISEDITPVGSVHMGAVFLIRTQDPEGYLPGDELRSFTWHATQKLSQLNLELWSELSLELINSLNPTL
ncbi:phosphoesterase [Desulfobacter hydrogenophilus]|uniref:Phosphoesterase n=1 Tax=Desulfobacter hydrogenophilus TaxID=2291 RepID=A0A328FI53_9BACT|nr:phosphoesterase [Desulfobacter hydrogenophilus]NDY70834.1 phosphoesterase [Desulfobacter hydrogenophilus]QBH11605.1 phosphoesterase [Desulfobacter hydrogenophilus]RAM03152.1 phosphoesterase [Desulfobacter hydrogenophilus]